MNFSTTDLLETVPSVLVYSPPGWGKTIAVGYSFPSALWVVSSPGNLHSFADWCTRNWEIAKTFSRTPVLPTVENPDPDKPGDWRHRKVDEGGMLVQELHLINPDGRSKILMFQALHGIVDDVVKLKLAADARGEEAPIKVVVFDELSEFASVVKAQAGTGWESNDKVKEVIKDIVRKLKAVGVQPIFICHEGQPKLQTEKDLKMYGSIQVPFGPNLPFASMRQEICGMFDVVLRLKLKPNDDETKPQLRVWETDAREDVIVKIRSLGIPPEDPRPLRDLLIAAKYKVG